jgi:hypothetical protein
MPHNYVTFVNFNSSLVFDEFDALILCQAAKNHIFNIIKHRSFELTLAAIQYSPTDGQQWS